MSSYVIAIGGTGARCLESLVHLCAMGLGPERLFILVVDADESNGNTERLSEVTTKYRQCKSELGLGGFSSIFRTEILTSRHMGRDILVWSPVSEDKSLAELFRLSTLEAQQKVGGDMVKLLYSGKELGLNWDRGFLGRPSLGAPVMAGVEEHIKLPPWSSIVEGVKNDLGQSADARVFVIGSIFGGTGASGFPVIGKILKKNMLSGEVANEEKLLLGGALMLPYFSFHVPAGESGVCASPKDFLIKTKAALEHYCHIWKDNFPYNTLYLMGDQRLDPTEKEFAPGGKPQENRAHFVDFLAALAGLQFSHTESGRGDGVQHYAGRDEEEIIDWQDLPYWGHDTQLKLSMLAFSTFAIAYKSFYLPLLRDRRFEKKRYLARWYADHFVGGALTSDQARKAEDNLAGYLDTYLNWLAEIHAPTSRRLRLMNPEALQAAVVGSRELTDGQFRSLLYSDSEVPSVPGVSLGYDSVWNLLCRSRSSQNISPVGKFAQMLFEASRDFCVKNYGIEGGSYEAREG